MELIELLKKMYKTPHYHRKRSFLLGTATPTMVSCHFLEEAVELQTEVVINNREGIEAEAADTLILLLHLFETLNLNFNQVEAKALAKLNTAFTTTRQNNPGFTRRNRDGTS